MPNRYIRNTAILAKIEATYNVDPTPTGAANAMLVSNLSISPLNATNVGRDLVRPYFGGSEQLVGVRNVQCSFDVELSGAGTAGTAPAYGPLLRACGMSQTIFTGQVSPALDRVEYLPVSSAFESLTVYWYDDGVLHRLSGARGTCSVMLGLAERPVIRYSFTGLYSTPTAAALPTTTLTAFQKPLVVTDANTGDVTFGATYTTGTLSGGTAYPSRGITLDVGNTVSHIPLLGGESVEITGRDVTGSVQLDLTAAQEVTFAGTVNDNATQSAGFQHGSVAGSVVILHAPLVQLINYAKQDQEGKRMQSYDLRLLPSAGNDELRLCVR